MTTDDEARYRAVQSRDARFDGKFFTGVTTTGVYCRPVCPAKTPKRENVRFFACAAAAEDAGFRPCKRCRPEVAPGTPAWNGTGTSVARALRMIEGGYLDERSVDDLAGTLGMGPRHLRRLFLRHLGASPKAVDTIRRTHFAALLLTDTTLPMASVALDSGFQSIRQFNEAFKRSFGVPPSRIRKRSRQTNGDTAGRTAVVRLSYRPPFDWDGMLSFLDKRAIAGVERVSHDSYSRSFSLDRANGSSEGVVSVTSDPARNSLVASITAAPGDLSIVASRVRRIFDLTADPAVISEHLRSESTLAPIAAQFPGIRIPGVWDSFEAAVRAVIGQQISVRASVALLGKLARLCGKPIASTGIDSIDTLFPTPGQVLEADLDALGMPQARRQALKAVAAAWMNSGLDRSTYPSLEALEDVLRPIRGIGPWSAGYIALRGFSEPDAFPGSDVAVRAAIGRRLGRTSRPATAEVTKLAERWRPWRGYAAVMLWKSLAPGSLRRK